MRELIERAAVDIKNSKYAIVLTGAGMSTESGIPDFRGPKGVWTTNKDAEAKAYERYNLFLRDPKQYWKEMLEREGTHGSFYSEMRKVEPNAGHYALAKLEGVGLIKCVVTQNIDGLHRKAGSNNVIEYHGSVNKVRCSACGLRSDWSEICTENLPPYCKCGGVIKMDVVHFKESIPIDVMENAEKEALKCDLMLICGTSAVVYPFANLPMIAKMEQNSDVRVIEVNAEPTPLTREGISDYLIQGKTGDILPQIVEIAAVGM